MGRHRKPLAVHFAHGTFRRDRHGGVAVPTSEPTPPLDLGGVAADEWRRVTAEMAAAGTLARIDAALLEMHCRAFARWRIAEVTLEEDGYVVTTSRGDQRPSPWLKIANDALALLRGFSADLGLSPTSRARLVTTSKSDASTVTKRSRA